MEDFCLKCVGLNKMVRTAVVSTLVLCSLLPLVASKPDGPPQAACGGGSMTGESMRPSTEQGAFTMIGHTASPQNHLYRNKAAPYFVQILNNNKHYYDLGEDIMVAIVANQTTGRRRFKGAMMQVYQVSCASADRSTIMVEGPPLGQFFQIGTSDESLLRPMTCHGNTDNTLAHFSPQWKINETAVWRVPGGLEGHIVFSATIVQDVNIYWTERHSRILHDPRDTEGGDVPRCGATFCLVNYILLTIGVAACTVLNKNY